MRLFIFTTLLILTACAQGPVGNANVPEPAKAVELNRYLGRWFELARYENRYEKGCEAVTADYSLRPDGGIRVINTCRQSAVDGPVQSLCRRWHAEHQITRQLFWPVLW
jgi:apolipoprotein D and lipocalin family protein